MRTVTANFSGGQTFVATESLWQYDYGFVLVLQGLQLPAYYEVHFSHTFTELADVNIGDANGVAIDDKFLRKDGYLFAWVYLHDEATDGYTKYQVKIPIAKRARPPEDPPTHEQQEALAQAITALNEETGRAEDAADRAEQAEANARASEDAAALSEQNASGSAEAAASSERNAAQSELDAAASAATAMDKASDAIQAANVAIAAANTAEGAAGSVTEDARRAEAAATHAEQYNEAAQLAKEGAVASEQAAQRHKNDAVDAKEAAQSAASTATQKAQAAEDYAGVANQKAEVATDKALEASLSATNASGSASNAAVSETQAEISATAAVNAEAEAKTARDLAQGYATAANESKLAAVAAQGHAETAQGKAEDAQEAAEAAKESVEDMLEAFQSPTATAETLEPGSDATASYNGETGVFTFGIPEGEQGEPGTDGYSPSASVSQDGDVTTITITDENGTTTADIDLSDYAKDDDLTELGNTKAPVITDTASGAIASFPDGADGMPVHKLLVNLSPKQDLHGYDSPWPGGGGKNILPPATSATASEGITVSNDNGKLTINGQAPHGKSVYVYFEPIEIQTGYIMAFMNSFVNATVYFLNGSTQVDYFSASVVNRVIDAQAMSTLYGKTFDRIRILFNADTTLSNANFSPMVVLDGADTITWTPYSNICPISGWTGCEVFVSGKNLFDKTKAVLYNNVPRFVKYGVDNYADTLPNGDCVLDVGTYTLSISGDGTEAPASMAAYDSSGNRLAIIYNNKILTFTTTSAGACYLTINFADTVTWADYNIQLELGSTATAYEEYKGNSYSVTFGETVWNAEHDVVSGHGQDTETVLTLNTANMNNSEAYPGWRLDLTGIAESGFNDIVRKPTSISNLYGMNTTMTGDGIIFFIPSIMPLNQTQLKALAIDVQIRIPLATPTDISTPPTPITALKGQNNIWANGDSVEVEYCADTKLYIDKKLAALVAALS